MDSVTGHWASDKVFCSLFLIAEQFVSYIQTICFPKLNVLFSLSELFVFLVGNTLFE
ncbi:hypothetical protein HMPREF9446_01443 [Bacteroides fluxus YIT 12057]|uniref:Uncharacterized protein n=1 Tax=Bacteroides fluxus YIT 12057 TaxID=763034 RepID=F3PRU1_9BACE|nr:hypothetical protein HMPREF9446_01443 [Bacteroides fluxus YIT 12057]